MYMTSKNNEHSNNALTMYTGILLLGTYKKANLYPNLTNLLTTMVPIISDG